MCEHEWRGDIYPADNGEPQLICLRCGEHRPAIIRLPHGFWVRVDAMVPPGTVEVHDDRGLTKRFSLP